MNQSQTLAKNRELLFGVALVVAVFAAYIPIWWAGFIWDDNVYLAANPVIVGPLGLKEIWTTSAADVCPLTMTTFWLEHKLWGVVPLPYHLITLLFHAANGVVLWRVLRQIEVSGAWLGALFWVLHPVQAESVAWVMETKNTESGFFFLLVVLFFVESLKQETTRPSAGRWSYGISVVCAGLAMAAKSSTVILPLVLVFCCLWVEGRWSWRHAAKIAPVLVLSIISALASLWTQSLQGADDPRVIRPWAERIAAAGDNVWFYLGKLIWPHPLIMTYRMWHIHTDAPLCWLPFLAVVIFSICLWSGRHSWSKPYLFAWGYFLAALLPVLGFVNATFFNKALVADHFQYLASMGPLALVGAGVAAFPKKFWRVSMAIVLSMAFAILSFRQAWIDGNSDLLWPYVVAWNDESWAAHNNLAMSLFNHGQKDAAVAQFQKACELAPTSVDFRKNLALAYFKTGQLDRAVATYRAATEIAPHDEGSHAGLAMALSKMGDSGGAIAEYRSALNLAPVDPVLANSLGLELMKKARASEAVAAFQIGVTQKPDVIEYRFNLGNAFRLAGRPDDAITQYRELIRLQPSYAEGHNILGTIFAQQGKYPEAMAEFQEALRIQPGLATAQKNLTQTQAIMGKGAKP